MSASTWTDARLWKLLDSRTEEADRTVAGLLRLAMPEIENVLRAGGTMPANFTLHDNEHSFRVADRMVEIAGDSLYRLSTYELTLLLLSAYLHDIGMTPGQGKVSSHFSYLLSGDEARLSVEERNEFQAWLDEEGAAPPLEKQGPADEVFSRAAELLAYYCRHRHNDWSEAWIRKSNLNSFEPGPYAGWIDDLVTVCRSHHEGYHELRQERFDPQRKGSRGNVVHLRYLACVLRVADILDFDPERTPAVVYRHRDIRGRSAVYWWKDHHVTLPRIDSEGRIEIVATPPDAEIHRAVDQMAREIEEELRLCKRLDDETHFAKYPGPGGDLPHQWTLQPYVHTRITPRNRAYEYIDGAFRPNTKKLLELLSGTAMYGKKMAAIRELLQNAFDAVNEQIALERLRESEPSDPGLEAKLRDRHRVTLTFDPATQSLSCADTGVGMTQAIIRDHVLVTGSARRADRIALARRCQQAGFNLELIGQFGIGVLSYFMLADRLTIRTCRSQDADDSEGTGWEFTTKGVGSFGELRREPKLARGTTVKLELREGKPEWAYEVRRYLDEILASAPCRVEFRTTDEEVEPARFGPGWVGRGVVYRWFDDSGERRHEFQEEGELPERWGRYKIELKYSTQPGGPTLAGMHAFERDGEIFLRGPRRALFDVPHAERPAISWRGLSVSLSSYRVYHDPVAIRIDFRSPEAGEISVNRASFQLNGKVEARVFEWIARRKQKLFRAFLKQHPRSVWKSLNYQVAGAPLQSNEGLHWAFPAGVRSFDDRDGLEAAAVWRPVAFPALCFLEAESPVLPGDAVFWNGGTTCQITSVPVDIGHNSGVLWLPWQLSSFPPHRVVLWRTDRPVLAALWQRFERARKNGHAAGCVCPFPPGWDKVWGGSFTPGYLLLNASNAVVHRITGDLWEKASRSVMQQQDPVETLRAVKHAPDLLVAWLLRVMASSAKTIWERVRRDIPEPVWEVVAGGAREPVYLWVQQGPYGSIEAYKLDGWSRYEKLEEIERLLPTPAEEFRLEVRSAESV
jgi:hypothetical protein